MSASVFLHMPRDSVLALSDSHTTIGWDPKKKLVYMQSNKEMRLWIAVGHSLGKGRVNFMQHEQDPSILRPQRTVRDLLSQSTYRTFDLVLGRSTELRIAVNAIWLLHGLSHPCEQGIGVELVFDTMTLRQKVQLALRRMLRRRTTRTLQTAQQGKKKKIGLWGT